MKLYENLPKSLYFIFRCFLAVLEEYLYRAPFYSHCLFIVQVVGFFLVRVTLSLVICITTFYCQITLQEAS